MIFFPLSLTAVQKYKFANSKCFALKIWRPQQSAGGCLCVPAGRPKPGPVQWYIHGTKLVGIKSVPAPFNS